MKKTFFFLLLALLFCTPANAQITADSLRRVYKSEPGTQPARIFTDGFESGNPSFLDFDGDGEPNLVLMTENPDGTLKDILVIATMSRDTLWEFQNVQQTLGFQDLSVGLGSGFLGFANPFGNDVRHAIFTNGEVVVLINPRDNSLSFRTLAPSILKSVTDFTGDGNDDLMVLRPDSLIVELWSIDQ